MKIIIEPYNPEWKFKFENESQILIKSIKEKNITIEHIGSTSVAGLGAKPIIDIMIGLQDFSTANNHIKPIVNLGYIYVSKYEDLMPFRRFFTKDFKGERTHHIHMVQFETEFWNRHLRFRDHLRNNPDDRNEYEKLKRSLAGKQWDSRNEYVDAKSDFIKRIEKKAVD